MKRYSPKTPVMRLVAKAMRAALKSGNKDSHATANKRTGSRWSRRKFIINSGKAALLGGLAIQTTPLMGCRKPDKQVDIVIVGAGIAGLNAAWHFKKNGIPVQIFESSNRVGGRVFSGRGLFGAGTTTELGAEFIDTNHLDMLNLVSEFGLSLRDVSQDNTLTKEAFFFGGQHYSLSQVISELAGVAPVIQAHIDLLNNNEEQAIDQLDHISLEEYLTQIGATAMLKALLTEAYVTEYGLDAGEQSCLNLIGLISVDTSDGHFNIYGDSDERFKIIGGNDLLTTKMSEKVSDSIQPNHTLIAITPAGDRYKLTFDVSGGGTKEVLADFVVLTLPFTRLRQVHLDKSLGIAPAKKKAINELGYGTNCKLMLGFNGRPWRDNGYAGYLYTDNGLQSGWDNTQMQDTPQSSYTIFSGGTHGILAGSGSAADQAAAQLPLLNQIFPGVQTAYNGTAHRFHWPSHPHSLGSYQCYKVGQWGTIAGWESKPIGNIFFAGEHCSLEFGGFMNGAAETGRLAAETIISML